MKNLPNIITISRVPFLFVIAAFATIEIPWFATVAFVLFIIAGVSDFFDGWLARKLGTVSNFGKLMDALTDKILILGLMIFLVDLLPPPILPKYYVFLVMLILVRELLITGLRLVAASSGVVLAAERSGKIKTILQFIALSVLLFYHAGLRDFAWNGTDAHSEIFRVSGLVSFWAATILTVTSGASYLTKYWRLLWDEPAKQ